MLGADGQIGFTSPTRGAGRGLWSSTVTEMRALPVGGAEAVGRGVAAADDDHVLAGGVDVRRRRCRRPARDCPAAGTSIAWCTPRRSRPGVVSSRGASAPTASTTASNSARSRARVVGADVGVDHELGALGAHLREPAVDDVLGHLEVRDAVAQQAAEPVVALVDGDRVAGAGQLLGRGEPGRARTRSTATRLPVRSSGRLRQHDALVERALDDRDLDLLDRHRVGVEREHAGGLARRRADPAGELGEVVGGVQPLAGADVVVAGDELVPLRDQVAERAAAVAERDAAVHAARGLLG